MFRCVCVSVSVCVCTEHWGLHYLHSLFSLRPFISGLTCRVCLHIRVHTHTHTHGWLCGGQRTLLTSPITFYLIPLWPYVSLSCQLMVPARIAGQRAPGSYPPLPSNASVPVIQRNAYARLLSGCWGFKCKSSCWQRKSLAE